MAQMKRSNQNEELGPNSAGQSGDIQGMPKNADADFESVEELAKEGNAFDADAVEGVEEGENSSEVRTRQVPEDDVPAEYLNDEVKKNSVGGDQRELRFRQRRRLSDCSEAVFPICSCEASSSLLARVLLHDQGETREPRAPELLLGCSFSHRRLPGYNQRRVDEMLAQKPDVKLVGSQHFADQQVVRAVILQVRCTAC